MSRSPLPTMAPNMAADLPGLQLGSTAQLALGVLALSLAVQLLEVALQRLKVGRLVFVGAGPAAHTYQRFALSLRWCRAPWNDLPLI